MPTSGWPGFCAAHQHKIDLQHCFRDFPAATWLWWELPMHVDHTLHNKDGSRSHVNILRRSQVEAHRLGGAHQSSSCRGRLGGSGCGGGGCWGSVGRPSATAGGGFPPAGLCGCGAAVARPKPPPLKFPARTRASSSSSTSFSCSTCRKPQHSLDGVPVTQPAGALSRSSGNCSSMSSLPQEFMHLAKAL